MSQKVLEDSNRFLEAPECSCQALGEMVRLGLGYGVTEPRAEGGAAEGDYGLGGG
jgi:hypothetical protein